MGCEYFGPAAYDDPNLARLIRDWRASCIAGGTYPRAVPLNKMYALYCCDLNCFPPRPATGLRVTVTPKQVSLLNRGSTIKFDRGNVTLKIIKEKVTRKRTTRQTVTKKRTTRPKRRTAEQKTTVKKPVKKSGKSRRTTSKKRR